MEKKIKELHIYDGFKVHDRTQGFIPDRIIIDKQTIGSQLLVDILAPTIYAMLNNK